MEEINSDQDQQGSSSAKELPIIGLASVDAGFKSKHQQIVFADPVAFRYIEEDPSTEVLSRRLRLEGYEIYIVEQWACSRVHPTFIIATYTGEKSHSILVNVLSVPTNENTWSPRLKVYFNAMSQFHARRKETPYGTLMVTNLSGFPSALSVIPVPDGDIKKHREDFIINENLKRLGCSGRAGLKLEFPNAASQAKFHQLYRVNDRIPFYESVIELVLQCQVALMMFSKLAPEYVDGLLCDVTERAINDWWTDIGTDFFNIEPTDGILGPTTVAALLGILMGARNRLSAYGAPVGKDAFDVASLKRGIAQFQKYQKLERTRRLDRQTLDRLHRATVKAASSDGWTVPKAVKSTVAELSGKGSELVMGMVGAREKAGIAEVETLDLETFVEVVHGERAKWLWHGKPRKAGTGDLLDSLAGEEEVVFSKDDDGGYMWTSKKRAPMSDGPPAQGQPGSTGQDALVNKPELIFSDDKEKDPKKNVLRTVTDRVSDAKSGFGRFRDVVGISGLRAHHNYKGSKDIGIDNMHMLPGAPESMLDAVSSRRSIDTPSSFEDPQTKTVELAEAHQPDVIESHNSSTERAPDEDNKSLDVVEIEDLQSRPYDSYTSGEAGHNYTEDVKAIQQRPTKPRTGLNSLHHIRSSSQILTGRNISKNSDRYPRNLSFTAIEQGVLPKSKGSDFPGIDGETTLKLKVLSQETTAIRILSDGRLVRCLHDDTVPWIEEQVSSVEELDSKSLQQQDELNALYYMRTQEHQWLTSRSTEIVEDKRATLFDMLKAIETIEAKLDYEVTALYSKVEDVEDGILEFERHVVNLERRVASLAEEKQESQSWAEWATERLGLVRRSQLKEETG